MNDSNDLVLIPIKSIPENEPIDPYSKKKGYRSWAETGKRISNMTPQEFREHYGAIFADIAFMADMPSLSDITLREIAFAAAYVETIRHPNPAMLNLIMEREEGKVPQAVISATGSIGDWMEYAKENNIEIDEVMKEAKKIMQEYDEPPKVVEGEIVE